jgi:hypothetical protein
MVKDKAAELASKKLPVERPRVGPFLALLALAVATEFILPRSKDTEEQEARLETTGACADARGRDATTPSQISSLGWRDTFPFLVAETRVSATTSG